MARKIDGSLEKRNSGKDVRLPVDKRLSHEEGTGGRASVYENLTVVKDEYRRQPYFI